jgi:dTDP-4-dehydrorhamnose 3,5-epimerase
LETIAIPTPLEGVLVVEIKFMQDHRGFFIENYHRRQFAAIGIHDEFKQDNHSRSRAGVLRGLHYQDMSAPMSKLVRCTRGRILDVAVDLRIGSPTFAGWFGVELTEENMKQLYVPVGFGHGFLTLSDVAEVQYKCSNFYAPESEGAVAWNDPEIGIEWPIPNPVLSRRDSLAGSLRQYRERPAFFYHS